MSRIFYIALIFAIQVATHAEGFLPELQRVDISDTCVAPGETFDITLKFSNSGTRTAATDLIPVIIFRLGDNGFVNVDGGLWCFGNVFHKPCAFTIPTTSWQPGQIVSEDPLTVNVPANAPNGVYHIYLGMYDRGGRVKFGGSIKTADVPFEANPCYDAGTIVVSRDLGKSECKPAVLKFGADADKPADEQKKYEWPSKTTVPADAVASWIKQPIKVGNANFSFTLDGAHNYAIGAINIEGTTFDIGGKFPTIVVYDHSDERIDLPANDARWKTKATIGDKSANVIYSIDGYSMSVDYSINGDMLEVKCTPVIEEKYKTLLISGGGASISIPAKKAGAKESAFIVVPETGGKLLQFDDSGMPQYTGQLQSWVYTASFVGMGYNGRGLILRAPQFGGEWSYGKKWVNGEFSLFGDVAIAFRPFTKYFNMPLVEKSVSFQFMAVPKDVNGDGVFNWVDIGVAYRKAFINGNKTLDKHLKGAYVGKIQVASPSENYLTYDRLIKEVRSLDFTNQVWWLVGAHSPAGNGYVSPPYAALPDPSHNGPDNYDYFAFKRDAEKFGARIGIHELFPDCSADSTVLSATSPQKPVYDMQSVKLRQDMTGNPTPTWGGIDWICYSKAINPMLNDGSFQKSIDEHFAAWQVRSGDTWHWDCFTAVGGRQDYSIEHPATNGSDLRDRIRTLRYIKEKGVHITSEGLQEGLSDYCDFSWVSQVELSPRTIPLLPVLFQGKTYYALSWSPAYCLLMGGKPAYESDHLDREGILQATFGHNVFWGLVADRTVKNVIKTDKGYRVEYEEGGNLDVDLAGMDGSRMTFTLTIDGKTYTPDNPPASSKGVKAKRVNGKYVIVP